MDEVREHLRSLFRDQGTPAIYFEPGKIEFRWIVNNVVHDFEFEMLSGYTFNRTSSEMEWEWEGE